VISCSNGLLWIESSVTVCGPVISIGFAFWSGNVED
jgi:hypothetical protein